MVNPISLPNFHEDQPSPLENTLASQIGSRNPMGAAYMLMAEQNRRGMAQDDYHQQIADTNDLQRQNMLSGMQEARIKAIGPILQHAQPGTLGAMRSLYPDLIPNQADSAQLEDSIGRNAAALQSKEFGEGAVGGMQYGAGVLPQGVQQGTPAVVQAAEKNAQSRVDAAGVMAGAKPTSWTQRVTTPDPKHPLDQQTERQIQYGGNTGAPPGVGGVIKPAPGRRGPSFGKDGVAGMNLMTGPLAPTDSGAGAAAPPSSGYSDGQVAAAVTALGNRNRAQYNDVMMQAKNNGGTPMVGKRSDGSPGLVGTNGQVY